MKTMLSMMLCWSAVTAGAEVVGRAVEYESAGVVCEGWQAYDDAVEGARPTVLIVHQWTGLTDYEEMRAGMLAELGYHVFAVDIYGKGVRPVPPAAGEEAGKYKADRALYRQRLNDGLKVAVGLPQTQADKVAAIGYCFGGTGVLELARSGAAVVGVVSFHGGLGTPTPEDAQAISGRVLALHGADDPFVPAEEVAGFEAEMKAAGVNYELVKYPGAVHAFTQKMAGDDPSKGAAYHAEADAQSWEKMRGFFDEVLLD